MLDGLIQLGADGRWLPSLKLDRSPLPPTEPGGSSDQLGSGGASVGSECRIGIGGGAIDVEAACEVVCPSETVLRRRGLLEEDPAVDEVAFE